MVPLEQDVNVAKRNTIKAQRNDMTQLAMVHMRRRKAVLEELERCASILTNLDSSKLRLERARNDVQLVQSYTLLKTALQEDTGLMSIVDILAMYPLFKEVSHASSSKI